MPDIVIEYPSTGATYSHDEYGVYEYDVYPPYSVLAGQTKRSFLGSFDTLEGAKSAYPDAAWHGDGSGYTEQPIPTATPEWLDPDEIGENWSEEDAY